MDIPVSQNAIDAGFVTGNFGAHMGRTIMLREFNQLLDHCAPDAKWPDYQYAIIDENILLKPTQSSRGEALRRLRQLYGLDDILIFKTLKFLAYSDSHARPLLALLCALARDATLRSTIELIVSAHPSEVLAPVQFKSIIASSFPGQLSDSTLSSAGRNTISSWEQSGHLHGLKQKVRQQVQPTPVVTAYALFLAYLNGERGEAMFESPWCKVLDQPAHILRAQAQQASQQGWLEYRFAGQVTEITFRHFLSEGKYERS